MVNKSNEKKQLLLEIEKFVLSQPSKFVSFPLAKQWYKQESVSRHFNAKRTSIMTYFSIVCNRLYEEGKLDVDIQPRGDSLVIKNWSVK